jgi:hypothetical protein
MLSNVCYVSVTIDVSCDLKEARRPRPYRLKKERRKRKY